MEARYQLRHSPVVEKSLVHIRGASYVHRGVSSFRVARAPVGGSSAGTVTVGRRPLRHKRTDDADHRLYLRRCADTARYCTRGVRVPSAAAAAGRADRRPPLPGGTAPYARLTLPPAPTALLIVNLGAPFRVRGGTDIEAAEYADGCAVATPTRAWEFGYPRWTRSVGVHARPWGLAPFLPMPAAELRDRPVTLEQVWGRRAVVELRERLAAADGPHAMLRLLEDELMRRLRETAGLDLVRHASGVIAATGGTVTIAGLSAAAGVSSTHLARRFKEIIGVTPKRLASSQRFTATLLALDPAGPVDWGAVAAGAGYFDPAHFGHEFREFTGLTPIRYIEATFPARASGQRAGRLGASIRLISYKSR